MSRNLLATGFVMNKKHWQNNKFAADGLKKQTAKKQDYRLVLGKETGEVFILYGKTRNFA